MVDKIPIAYDCKLKQPGCVLIQAAMGGNSAVSHRFKTEDWLLAPTPDMRVYGVTEEQLNLLVEITNERNKDVPRV